MQLARLHQLLLCATLLTACQCGSAQSRPDTNSQTLASHGIIEAAYRDAAAALSVVLPSVREGVTLVPTELTSLAGIYREGDGWVILYNREAVLKIMKKHGYLAVVAVFAHELGHRLDASAGLPILSSLTSELSADMWAGCAVAILGKELDGLVAFFFSIGGGASHPSGEAREIALKDGHRVCSSVKWF